MRSIFSTSPRQRPILLGLLFVLALSVRTMRALQQPVVNPDAIRFIEQAQRMTTDPVGALRGEVYHPLHSLCTLIVHTLTSSLFHNDRAAWLFSVQSVGVLCGAIVAFQILLLARAFGAPFWASLGASLAWIVGRRTSAYGADGLSDMLFLSLFAASLLVAIRATRSRHHFSSRHTLLFLLAGFLSGLSYLARPEGLAALLITLLFLLSTLIPGKPAPSLRRKLLERHPLSLKHVLTAISSLFLGAALPALPYMFIIRGLTHKKSIALSLPSHHALAALVPTGDFTWALFGKIGMELWETFGFGPWLALFGALLIAPHFWGRPRLRPLVIIWFLLWSILMVWLVKHAGYLDGRHTLPLQLLLHGILALVFVQWTKPMRWWMNFWRRTPAWSRFPNWMRSPHWPNIFAAGAILLTLLPGIIRLNMPPQDNQEYMAQAAAWVEANLLPNVTIYDRQHLVGYYSGHPYDRWTGSPDKPLLQQLSPAQPHIIAYVFRPGLGEKPQLAIGPYQAIAAFHSPLALHGDLLILYAPPNTPIMSQGNIQPLTTLPQF